MKIRNFLSAMLLICIACSPQSPKNDKAQRIISLAPNITEILYAMGLEERVVAVTDYCTYPLSAKEKQSIGGLLNPNIERITALKPDLLIATESFKNLDGLIDRGRFDIVFLPDKRLEDVVYSIDSIGVLTGATAKSDSLVAAIKDSLNFYKENKNEKGPTAILVLGRDQGSTRNIGISGPGAFMDELWGWAGGTNAFPELQSSYVQLNREDLLQRDPDIIIEFKSINNGRTAAVEAIMNEWYDLLRLSAVRSGNIYILQGNKYFIPGPRIYLLAREYSRIIESYKSRK